MYIYIQIYTYTCIQTYVQIHTYILTHMFVYTYIHISLTCFIYMYIYHSYMLSFTDTPLYFHLQDARHTGVAIFGSGPIALCGQSARLYREETQHAASRLGRVCCATAQGSLEVTLSDHPASFRVIGAFHLIFLSSYTLQHAASRPIIISSQPHTLQRHLQRPAQVNLCLFICFAHLCVRKCLLTSVYI